MLSISLIYGVGLVDDVVYGHLIVYELAAQSIRLQETLCFGVIGGTNQKGLNGSNN